MTDKIKKILTICLTVFFMVVFILVGVGSCGGIRYLIDNRSNVATVYADDTGSGSETVTTTYVTVPLTMVNLYVDGVRNLLPPPAYSNTEINDYVGFGSDLKFEYSSLGTFKLITFDYDIDRYVVYRSDIDLSESVEAFPIMFIHGDKIWSGALAVTASTPYLPEYGKILSIRIDIVAGSSREDNIVFALDFYFEGGTVHWGLEPNEWDRFGGWEMQPATRFSFFANYNAFDGYVPTVDLQEYYQQGYQDAKDYYFDLRYDEGYNEGFLRGEIAGASNANEYSFISLMSAVFNVPVQTFTNLLSFELFGYNLSVFYRSLFSLCLVILVLRLIL